MLYITFLRSVLSTLGIYPDELDPEIFYFQRPIRGKLKRLYQKIFKDGNGDQKCLRFPDLRDNNFEVIRL